MRFTSLLAGIAALAIPATSVVLKCVDTKNPYCCAAAVSEDGIEVGVECVKQTYGHMHNFCNNTEVKICCSKAAIDVLDLGLLLLCELPDGLLGTLGPILGGGTPS